MPSLFSRMCFSTVVFPAPAGLLIVTYKDPQSTVAFPALTKPLSSAHAQSTMVSPAPRKPLSSVTGVLSSRAAKIAADLSPLPSPPPADRDRAASARAPHRRAHEGTGTQILRGARCKAPPGSRRPPSGGGACRRGLAQPPSRCTGNAKASTPAHRSRRDDAKATRNAAAAGVRRAAPCIVRGASVSKV